MVSRQQVLASNALLPSTLTNRLVAVFAGATSGIGLATLKSFVNYTVAPRIYLLARNTASAERVVAECKTIKSDAQFTIVKVDLSSVRETDRACEVVKNNEKRVNLIVLSMGEIRMDRACKLNHYTATRCVNHDTLILGTSPINHAPAD